MSYVLAAVVLIGAVATLNLVLTCGVIRRLRQHTELIGGSRPATAPEVMLGVGEIPAEFVALTTDGEPVSRDLLAGEQLIGFFSPHCAPCREQAPRFAERAAAMPGGRGRVLAVLVGDERDVADLRAELEPVARVVLEQGTGPGTAGAAFGVRGFPAICRLNSAGRVSVAGFRLPGELSVSRTS
ncbi:MAG: hypothetical protein V7603_4347 [Micromonosporaceae bacterium]